MAVTERPVGLEGGSLPPVHQCPLTHFKRLPSHPADQQAVLLVMHSGAFGALVLPPLREGSPAQSSVLPIQAIHHNQSA